MLHCISNEDSHLEKAQQRQPAGACALADWWFWSFVTAQVSALKQFSEIKKGESVCFERMRQDTKQPIRVLVKGYDSLSDAFFFEAWQMRRWDGKHQPRRQMVSGAGSLSTIWPNVFNNTMRSRTDDRKTVSSESLKIRTVAPTETIVQAARQVWKGGKHYSAWHSFSWACFWFTHLPLYSNANET